MNEISLTRLSDISHLTAAWQIVKAKGTAGGIDNVSIDDYSKHWMQNLKCLSQSLLSRTWKPQPYMAVEVPKKSDGTRTLGLLSIEDKIVQQALKSLIEPAIEPYLHRASYAYRASKGHTKAVRRCLHECRQPSNKFFLRIDIKNFFDRIDREILMRQLTPIIRNKDVLAIVQLCISMGRVSTALQWDESPIGIPQGAVLSPLLSNLYLYAFDTLMGGISNAYIRYADDCVAWFSSEKSATSALSAATDFLSQELKLTLNDKVKIGTTKQPMAYLGVEISPQGLNISDEKRLELEHRIMQITTKNDTLSATYIKSIDGIRRYYVKILPDEFGILMDHWLGKAVQNYVQEYHLNIKEASALFSGLDGFVNKELIRQWIKRAAITEQQSNKVRQVVASRKREYQRIETENSELAISAPGYFIGLNGRGLTLKKNGQSIKIPPTGALKHISVFGDGVSISSNAIAFCMKQNIPIDFFDIHAQHIASILSPRYLNNSLWIIQSELEEKTIKEIGKKIILSKIKNQYSLSKYFNKYHKFVGVDTAFNQYKNSVETVIAKVKEISENNLPDFRKKLISYEATAAAIYWEYVRDLIDDDIEGFYSRVKQGATDLVNSMLNYGYAILYPRIWQTALRHRLNPYSGFIHYAEGNANLVFDMIELFRAQAVDRVVIALIQKKESLKIQNGQLDDSTKKKLITAILERLNRKERYRGEMHSFTTIIDAQFRELVDSITSGATFRPYLAKW